MKYPHHIASRKVGVHYVAERYIALHGCVTGLDHLGISSGETDIETELSVSRNPQKHY